MPPGPAGRAGKARQELPRRAAVVALAAAVGFGVLADLALRRDVGTVAGAVAAGAVPVLLGLVRPTRWRAGVVAGTAVGFAPWLAWRASPWLLTLDVLAIMALVLLQASFASGGRLGDRFWVVARRLVAAGVWSCAGPWWLWVVARSTAAARPGDQPRRDAWRAGAVRAVRVLPVLAVVLALLASGDALFASWFRVPVDGWAMVGHASLAALGAVVFAGLHHSATHHPEPVDAAARRAQRFAGEAVLVLAGLAVCLGGFLATQVVAARAGKAYVLARTGLTYADYARRGFFQLLAVALITLGAVVVARHALAGPEGDARRQWVATTLGLAVVAETLGLVWVCLHRLDLYEHEYGLTMLRLYSTTFAWWVGAVVALVGVALVARGRGAWFVPTVLASAAVGVLAMNVANPEQIVVRHQLAHARRTGRLDAGYVVSLSQDAAPVIVDAIRTGNPTIAGPLRDAWCAAARRDVGLIDDGRSPADVLSRNHARSHAADLRRAVCP